MKRKHLLTLVVAAVVLVALGVSVNRTRHSAWEGRHRHEAENVLPSFPVNDVATVTVESSEGSVTLARKDGVWRIAERYDYPVGFTTLRDFMVDLAELKAAQTVRIGPSQYGRLSLEEPGKGAGSGTKVTFKDQSGKAVETLIFGKEHMRKSDDGPQPGPMGMMGGGSWPDGRYLLVPARNSVFLVSKTFSSVSTDPSRWVDKEFFKVTDMKEAWLSEGETELWRVSRDTKTADLKLAGDTPEGKEVDAGKLSSIRSAFGWASFTDIADPSLSPEETGMDNPKVYTVRDFDGFVHTVRIGKETTDGKVHLQVGVVHDGPKERVAEGEETPEDKAKKDEEFKKTQEANRKKAEETAKRLQGWTYLVSKYTVDSVLKSRDDLLKDKPAPPAEPAPEKAAGEEPAPAATPAPEKAAGEEPAPAATPAPGKPAAAAPPAEPAE